MFVLMQRSITYIHRIFWVSAIELLSINSYREYIIVFGEYLKLGINLRKSEEIL
jgi:hypothetical protein